MSTLQTCYRRRLRNACAVSAIALLSASCASYAGYDQAGYQTYSEGPYYDYGRQTDRPDYQTSGEHGRGIEAARDAHRRFSKYRAEQLDGDCERRVVIEYGETLSDLAEYCDVSVNAIFDANPGIRNPRNISVGEHFFIPDEHANIYHDGEFRSYRGDTGRGKVYAREERNDFRDNRDYHLVRRGDTLADIAGEYDVSLADVIALNRNVRPRDLEIGDRIYLPEYASLGHVRRVSDSDPSLDRWRPAVSISPVRGPRNGEIRLSGSNFGDGEQVAVLYGDHRDRLLKIRTIQADRHGRIDQIVRLPDAYQSDAAYFAMQRGNDTYISDTAYSVDYDGRALDNASGADFGDVSSLLQGARDPYSSALLRATESEVYRNDSVSLLAVGFPPNTPIAIYGGPSRDSLTKISEIRSGPSGLFQTEVRVPQNVQGDTVLFVAAVEDGARTYFTERVRVRSEEHRPEARGVSAIYPDAEGRDFDRTESSSTTLSRGIERKRYGGRDFLSRFQRRDTSGVVDINAGGQGAISGVLTNEGERCPTLRDDAGNIFSLLGDLGQFSDGDRVLIRGSTAADDRICKQSETIQIFAIEAAPW